MLHDSPAFSGFSVNDIQAAKQFYGQTLGLDVVDSEMGALEIKFSGRTSLFIYPKDDHAPATFTVLNFPVARVDDVVDELTAKGVVFEHYEGMHQDDRGVSRSDMGPVIAWFKDPAGNILAVLEME